MAKKQLKVVAKSTTALAPLTGIGGKEAMDALATMGEAKKLRQSNNKEITTMVGNVMVSLGYYMAHNAGFTADNAMEYFYGGSDKLPSNPNVLKARRTEWNTIGDAMKRDEKRDWRALWTEAKNRARFLDFCRAIRNNPKITAEELANVEKTQAEPTMNAGDVVDRIVKLVNVLADIDAPMTHASKGWIAPLLEMHAKYRAIGQLQTSSELNRKSGTKAASKLAAILGGAVPTVSKTVQ